MSNVLAMVRATVVSIEDPDGLGRVKLSMTRNVGGSPAPVEGWATVGAAPMGPSATAVPIYAVGDSVLYAADKLPFDGAVVLCLAARRTTVPGAPAWSFSVSLGQDRRAIIQASSGALQIRTTAGQAITLESDGSVSVTAATKMVLSAAEVQISASLVTVDAGMTKVSGTVQCDTLIANTVVANSYTPGAGNTW